MAEEFITERELTAHLVPINRKLDELGTGVEKLLLDRAREEGAEEALETIHVHTRDEGARRLAWGSLATALVGGLWWVQDVVAKVANHH